MLKELFDKAPYIKQTTKFMYNSIPEYYRYGGLFKKSYNMLQQSQWWSRKQHEEYQMIQIEKLLKHAYETVPYYNRIFNEMGIKPQYIQNFNDLKKLPFLTKDIIRNNLNDLISTKYKKNNLKSLTTGGTTKIPMEFYADCKAYEETERAFITNMWSIIGYDAKKINRSAILRGTPIKKGIYEYNGRDLLLSSSKIYEANTQEYIDLIQKFNPDFIQAYPSSIAILSGYMAKNNIRLKKNNIKAIICASENINENQRKLIEDVFDLRVFSFYGHSEHSGLAAECDKSKYYHIFSEYGYVEILNDNDLEVEKEDECGEIVCTGFNNYVMPFIRYRTNDIAINTNQTCPCNRNYRIIKGIEGRKQDYFIDKCGNKITFTLHDMPIHFIKEKITEYQYVQEEAGKVILNIRLNNIISDNDINKIKEGFYKYYNNFEISINLVDTIERTISGKARYLVQQLDICNYY